MNCSILGFIRPELNYESKEALVRDIEIDIETARLSLEREHWMRWKGEAWLMESFAEGDIVSKI